MGNERVRSSYSRSSYITAMSHRYTLAFDLLTARLVLRATCRDSAVKEVGTNNCKSKSDRELLKQMHRYVELPINF